MARVLQVACIMIRQNAEVKDKTLKAHPQIYGRTNDDAMSVYIVAVQRAIPNRQLNRMSVGKEKRVLCAQTHKHT